MASFQENNFFLQTSNACQNYNMQDTKLSDEFSYTI